MSLSSSSSGARPSALRHSGSAKVPVPPNTTTVDALLYSTASHPSYNGLVFQTLPHPLPTHSAPQWGYHATNAYSDQYDPYVVSQTGSSWFFSSLKDCMNRNNSTSAPSTTYSSDTRPDVSQPPFGSPLDQSFPYTNERPTSPTTTTGETCATRKLRLVYPPFGVPHCAECRTEQSPEWRKGPSGEPCLCNA